MERVRLWRDKRQTLVGVVELDAENRRLIYLIDDEREHERVAGIFDETGKVTWGWTRFGDNDWVEHRAEPNTSPWFWFVVANILYPKGYQADFGVTD